MKISELSERSGVPLPTIKFYIREGLLPAGERTAKNQASYGEEHLERLDLVRALKDDAGLGIQEIARIVQAATGTADRLAGGLAALERKQAPDVDRKSPEFRESVKFLFRIAELVGWTEGAANLDNYLVTDAARALVPIRRAFPYMDEEHVSFYANMANELARFEIPDDFDPVANPTASLKYALLGTYLFEPLILALRRIAHAERATALRRSRGKKKPTPKGR